MGKGGEAGGVGIRLRRKRPLLLLALVCFWLQREWEVRRNGGQRVGGAAVTDEPEYSLVSGEPSRRASARYSAPRSAGKSRGAGASASSSSSSASSSLIPATLETGVVRAAAALPGTTGRVGALGRGAATAAAAADATFEEERFLASATPLRESSESRRSRRRIVAREG